MNRDRPILFHAGMTEAVLEDYKTATRRLIRPRYQKNESGFEVARNKGTGQRWVYAVDEEGFMGREIVPPYLPDDILYIRETWAFIPCIGCNGDYARPGVGMACYDTQAVEYDDGASISDGCFVYRAGCRNPERITWRPSIYMPKAAARIWLKVKDVRVERLQEMTLDDFLKEGVRIPPEAFNDPMNAYLQARNQFIGIWDSTLSQGQQDLYSWEANPWTWVIEFERCRKPESEG